jgi:hypothetical protein
VPFKPPPSGWHPLYLNQNLFFENTPCSQQPLLLRKLDAGHSTKLDIKHEAVELGMLRVGEECFREGIVIG